MSKKSDKGRRRNVKMRAIAESLEKYGDSRRSAFFSDNSKEGMSGISSDLGSRLSESEAALLDGEGGRLSDARAARLLAAVTIQTEGPRWTAELVKLRLRSAARGCEKLVGRIGPGNSRGFWPAPLVEFADLVAMAANAEALAEFYNERNAGAGGARDVSEIEDALQWPIRYLGAHEHDGPRMALHIWLWCEARRQAFEQHCKGLSCSRRTAYYRRDAAIRIILAGLIKNGVNP